MNYENFLEKWYNIKRENCINSSRELDLSINLFPGNLQKILTKIRNYGTILKSQQVINKYFYSKEKEIYFKSSFVYFEFVCYIINRINNEIENLYCTGTYNNSSKAEFIDIRDIFNKENNKKYSSVSTSVTEFWSNGSFKLKVHSLNKEEISLTESLFVDEIVNEAYNTLLEKVEKIIEGKESIYTESLIIKDKITKVIDFKINLIFFNEDIKVEIENPYKNDLKGLESKIEIIYKKMDNYKKEIKEMGYPMITTINEIKNILMQLIKENFPKIDLFKLNEKDDFKITTKFLDDSFMKKGKYIINEGYISKESFKEMARDLKHDQEFSQLLIESIL